MTISIIHPSRGRPQQAFETAKKWLESADNSVQYILIFEPDQASDYYESFKSIYTQYNFRLPPLVQHNSAIEAINYGAKFAKGHLLVTISDDTDCFKGWDTALTIMCYNRSDFLAKNKDGIQKTLVTMPVMDKAYYERFGYIYHPDYIHMGCDVELTAVAIMTGKYVELPLLFPHNHYSTGKTPKDAINDKNDLTYAHGDEVLKRHLENNFGIEKPVCNYDEIVWH